MLRSAARLILLAAALPAIAQSVTAVSSSAMLFSDPAFGVSFRFPSGWSFSKVEPNSGGPSLAIAFTGSPTVSTGLRGLVANETLPGIRSWPHTVFSSVEFGYDGRPMASADACQKAARESWQVEAAPVTLNGVSYWHGTATGAALNSDTEEDIYAAFVAGSCLRFDLAVVYSRVPGRDRPRELTTREKAVIHTSLTNILNSVRVAAAGQ